jgi:hypothetical protein
VGVGVVVVEVVQRQHAWLPATSMEYTEYHKAA